MGLLWERKNVLKTIQGYAFTVEESSLLLHWVVRIYKNMEWCFLVWKPKLCFKMVAGTSVAGWVWDWKLILLVTNDENLGQVTYVLSVAKSWLFLELNLFEMQIASTF